MIRRPTTVASRRRSAARMACVQALYEIDVSGAGSDPVLREFLTDRWMQPTEAGAMPVPDTDLLGRLVRGVCERRPALDAVIASALSADRSLDRLDVLLRSILRAAAFELIAMPEVPTKVVINEYMNVAHAFFGGGEPALVNGVLDRIARDHRPAPATLDSDDDPGPAD